MPSTVAALQTMFNRVALTAGVKTLADAAFLDLVNLWQKDLQAQIYVLRNDNAASPTATIANTEAYNLPSDYLHPKMPIEVRLDDVLVAIEPDWHYFEIKERRIAASSTATTATVQVYGTYYKSQLLLNPAPSDATGEIKVWYYALPTSLSAVSTNSVQMPDQYDETFVEYALSFLLDKYAGQGFDGNAALHRARYQSLVNRAMGGMVVGAKGLRAFPLPM